MAQVLKSQSDFGQMRYFQGPQLLFLGRIVQEWAFDRKGSNCTQTKIKPLFGTVPAYTLALLGFNG
jgi:hypothetical protein